MPSPPAASTPAASTRSSPAALIAQLGDLLGKDGCIPWPSVEAAKQRQIAKATEIPPVCLAVPTTVEQLAEVMSLAARQHWRVLPVGQASKLGWGGIAKEVDIALSSARLNRVVHHAVGDFTVTVESGMTLKALSTVLADAGQFLAVDPAFADQATIGGIVATADTGSLRQRYGGLRDMLIGVQFVRYDGQLAKAGGQVVKNVAGYDLMKLMTGSYGTLGILSELTFRLYPVQAVSRSVVLSPNADKLAADRLAIDAVAKAAADIRLSGLTPVAFDIVLEKLTDQASSVQASSVSLVARFQGIAAGVEEQIERLEAIAHRCRLTVKQLDQSADAAYWQQAAGWRRPDTILCKVGLKPSAIAPLLNQLLDCQLRDSIKPPAKQSPSVQARLNGSSGLGWVQWSEPIPAAENLPENSIKEMAVEIERMRSHCQQSGGFLSLLQAPTALKQTIDIWGYSGNALQVMTNIKQKFDPQRLLSPGRFVGDI